MSKIPEHLIEKIKTIPEKPGVYKMKNKDESIIYIGKSKTLKSRVKSYFYANHKQNKIKQMVSFIEDIEITVTDTHLEAQILECELIKKVQPIYNRQFKNDKKYVYLKIENDSRLKPLSIVKERLDEYCIGPFRSKNKLLEAINIFQNIYPINKCGPRYEFEYKVLTRSLAREEFEENRKSLIEIFFKEECMNVFLFENIKKMEEASSKLKYDTASMYRDMIGYLEYINLNNSNHKSKLEERDILIGEPIEGGYKLFFISNNLITLKRRYDELTSDFIEVFLRQAKELNNEKKYNIDEKKELDFKKLISAEIKDNKTKEISFIDSQFNIDQFIERLLAKTNSNINE